MGEVQARTVLWHIVFIGFAINYLVCFNLNITIVEMVISPIRNVSLSAIVQGSQAEMAGFTQTSKESQGDVEQFNKTTATLSTGEFTLESIVNEEHMSSESSRFNWNEHEQALVLGSFFWTHWITQIPGGILAKKYGTKLVFGLSNAISCWICFLIPMVSYMDLRGLLIARMLQGLLTGLSWPAMHHMTAKWVPPNERSKFVTAYFGSAVGIAVAFPLFAFMMHWSSWIWVFHLTGILGSIWWLAWLYLAYDSPAEHPRISDKELRYIEKSLGSMIQNGVALKTPWLAIFTSRPVWMNVIGQWGGVWSIFTVLTQAPTYFKVIHNWGIRAVHWCFFGIPHILRMTFAYVFSSFADYLLQTNKMSRTNVRKLATGISCILNGCMMLALAFFGTNRILAIIFVCLATMLQGSGTSGPLSSMIDIAPNFAGIISGICGTIGSMPGFISAYIVGVLTLNNQTFSAWANVFLIAAGVLIACGLLYICFADSTLQKWNNDQSLAGEDDKREQLMKDNSEEIFAGNELFVK